MKRNPKSALIGSLALAAALAGLTACDAVNKIDWPHVYGPNEVPASVASEPRDVEVPPPLPPDTTYPRLGDVPSKPKNFSPPKAIDQTKQLMETERTEGQALKHKLQEPSQSASDRHFAFTANAGEAYAIQDAGSEIYTLELTDASPPINSLQLPDAADGVSQYIVTYRSGKGWSKKQLFAPGATIAVQNAMAVRVVLLDVNGMQLGGPEDFTFYLTFGKSGAVEGNVTGNEAPIGNTYVPVQLPPGGNPPISATTSGASK